MRSPRSRRLTLAVLATLLALAGLLASAPRARAAEACFAETGHCVRAGFLDYWLAHGGLAINGYPLSDEFTEVLEDGKPYTVQYFERARFEWHLEIADPQYRVLLGQFGRRVLREAYAVDRKAYPGAVAPAQPIEGQAYFAETGHNLGGRFLDYWLANGGLAQFGFPLTEERFDTLEDGKLYRTQYFERARFEAHPENAGTPYEVLLGQFGRRMLAENALLQGEFGAFFETNEWVQVQLGGPVSPVVQSPGAAQPFERGRMFYAERAPAQREVRGGFLDARAAQTAPPLAVPALPTPAPAPVVLPPGESERTIYALCGGAQSGELITPLTSFSTYFFPDTWDASQPAGGGPGPRPGLYEPQRGFGKVWRDRTLENGLVAEGARRCLGYATTPSEASTTVVVQYFSGGTLLLSDTPEGRFIYVLAVGRYSNSGAPTGVYLRVAAPAR